VPKNTTVDDTDTDNERVQECIVSVKPTAASRAGRRMPTTNDSTNEKFDTYLRPPRQWLEFWGTQV